MNQSNVQRFYEIEQQKLLLDFSKISLYTKHPGTVGSYREARLRQYLRALTPGALTVGTGLVSSWDQESGNISDNQSRQVDCLVYDKNRDIALLGTDEFAIVEPRSIFAGIEVKSSLSFYREYQKDNSPKDRYPFESGERRFRWAGTMVDALRNISSLKRVCDLVGSEYDGVFRGVFAYSLDFNFGDLYWALDNREIQQQLDIDHVDQLPAIICVPGKLDILFSGRDFLKQAPHHDAYTSFMNVLEAVESHPAYPLQLFSTMYVNQVRSKHSQRLPDKGGLFSADGGAQVKVWRRHFKLNSEGYEDQS